jgi:hypothetical protein
VRRRNNPAAGPPVQPSMPSEVADLHPALIPRAELRDVTSGGIAGRPAAPWQSLETGQSSLPHYGINCPTHAFIQIVCSLSNSFVSSRISSSIVIAVLKHVPRVLSFLLRRTPYWFLPVGLRLHSVIFDRKRENGNNISMTVL